ncbi:MAG: hypothetical protein J7L61_00240 [Thermoplasmata archaeon]|nr:hypothetical protein [Thermoplasmata archaeon]
MKKHITLILALLVVGTVVTAGCVGGGDKSGTVSSAKMEEMTGTTGVEGEKAGEASIEPVPVTEKVSIVIPATNVTSITFTISVSDDIGEYEDSQSTDPDDVSGSLEGETGGGNQTTNIPAGTTPYQQKVSIRAPEGETLPSSWTLTLNVVLKAGQDEWPGPMIWYGVPDHGFSYNVTVEYTYLAPA